MKTIFVSQVSTFNEGRKSSLGLGRMEDFHGSHRSPNVCIEVATKLEPHPPFRLFSGVLFAKKHGPPKIQGLSLAQLRNIKEKDENVVVTPAASGFEGRWVQTGIG